MRRWHRVYCRRLQFHRWAHHHSIGAYRLWRYVVFQRCSGLFRVTADKSRLTRLERGGIGRSPPTSQRSDQRLVSLDNIEGAQAVHTAPHPVVERSDTTGTLDARVAHPGGVQAYTATWSDRARGIILHPSGVRIIRELPVVSLALNHRLIAGKPPACFFPG